MTWRPTDGMTRDELVAELEQLREVVERLAASIPSAAQPGDEEELMERGQD